MEWGLGTHHSILLILYLLRPDAASEARLVQMVQMVRASVCVCERERERERGVASSCLLQAMITTCTILGGPQIAHSPATRGTETITAGRLYLAHPQAKAANISPGDSIEASIRAFAGTLKQVSAPPSRCVQCPCMTSPHLRFLPVYLPTTRFSRGDIGRRPILRELQRRGSSSCSFCCFRFCTSRYRPAYATRICRRFCRTCCFALQNRWRTAE
jgi:hypothetical protein